MTVTPVRRPRCNACALPLRTCLCALVTRVPNEVEVVLLQHPDEVDEAKGSARLLRLSLARCRILTGEAFEPDRLLAVLDGDVSGAALLYPSDTVTASETSSGTVRPTRLVVLDGTWRKSLKMLHANPLLQTLPRWSLPAPSLSRYAILRKARWATQVSTLEATCAALADIEGNRARYEPLLKAFEFFVGDRVARSGRAG